MNRVKRFGELIISQDPNRHTAEVHIHIATINTLTNHDRAVIKAVI